MSSAEDKSKPSFTTAQAAVQITRDNTSWSQQLGQGVTKLTYGFFDAAPPADYGNESETFSRVNELQREAVFKAIAAWADVANITFTAVNPTGFTNNATLLIGNFVADDKSDTAAHAYAPSTKNFDAKSEEGDFWFNIKATSKDFEYGSYNYSTVLHELGHSLGLAHPGNYNAGEERDATYAADAVYQQDSLEYTIMSYFGADNTGATHTFDGTTYYGSTALLDDIAAIQRLYGANMHTRTGDTTYGFHSTEKGGPFDITSSDQQVVFSIWDAGGTNALDLSGYSTNQIVDLREGKFSSAGELTDNISIAFGTLIQTGIGGSGNDKIYGNDANNALEGKAGSDFIDGGGGINAAIFSGPTKNYEIVLTAGNSPFMVHDLVGTDGTDTLVSIQDLRFTGQELQTGDFLLSRGLFSQESGFFGTAYNIFHLYIAEENRAPDALGLYYWVARVAQGAKISDIADSFAAQPETSSVYSLSLGNEGFVTAVYNNLFHRPVDQAGFDYWVGELSRGANRGDLALEIALGAKDDDATIIANKVGVARAFSQTQGLTNADWARDVLSGVDATDASVTAANEKIAHYVATATAPQTSELMVKLIGIPDPVPVA